MFKNILVKLIVASYIFSVIFYSYREGKAHFTKYAGSLMLIVFLIRLFARKNVFKLKSEWSIISFWMFLALISIFYAIDSNAAINKLITLLQVIPISFALYYLIISDRLSIFIFYVIVISTIASSVLAYLDPVTYSQMGRLMATFNNANLYGLLLVVSIIATTRLSMISSNIFIWCIGGVIIFSLMYMLIQTGSRKAIILLFVSFASISYFFSKKNYQKRPVSVIVLVSSIFLACIIGVGLLQQSTFFYRFDNLQKSVVSSDISKAEGSDKGRFMLYAKAINTLIANPFGVGIDNFRNVDRGAGLMTKSIGSYGHSNFIEIATGTGVIGLAVYYSFYWVLFSRLLRLRKVKWNDDYDEALFDISMLLMIVIFMYDFAMVSYYEKLNWVIIAILLANTHILTLKIKYGNE